MTHLVILLEEPSAREFLKGLLPRVLPDTIFVQYVVFEGKQDLERNMVRRMRGWRAPDTTFIVMRDQDLGECQSIKQSLAAKCVEAHQPDAIVRIVCRELESWYFGDLAAVEPALGVRNLLRYSRRQQYRVPDEIVAPARELMKITNNAYQKVSGSRAIGPHLSYQDNNSHSFGVFMASIHAIMETEPKSM